MRTLFSHCGRSWHLPIFTIMALLSACSGGSDNGGNADGSNTTSPGTGSGGGGVKSTAPHTIGGTVSNLVGSGLTLAMSGQTKSVSSNGSFTFETAIDNGTSYDVTILNQPRIPSQNCTISNASGVLNGSDVTNLAVSCKLLTPRFAYVANWNGGSISAFSIDASTGSLINLGASPYLVGGNPSYIAIHPSGKYAFVTNYGISTVTVYAIDKTTGSLTVVGSGSTGSGPRSVAIDPEGQYAYVADKSGISAFKINTMSGSLDGVVGSPFSSGLSSQSVAVDPTGKFAYASVGSKNVNAYAVDSSTGALTYVASVSGNGARSIVVEPKGRFVYIANDGLEGTAPLVGSFLGAYVINSTTGALTEVTGSPYSNGSGVNAVTPDPSGKYLFYTQNSSATWDHISPSIINTNAGSLTDVQWAATGHDPTSVAVDPSGKYVYVTNSAAASVSVYEINSSTGDITNISTIGTGNEPASIAIVGFF